MKITRKYLKKIILEEVKNNLRQTAGVIIVDRNSMLDEPHVLVLRAYRNWDFPKGGFDENHDTDLRDTAIRETWEETTLEEGQDYKLSINKKVRSNPYGGTGGKKIATYYLAERLSEKDPFLAVNPEIGKPEHEEWRWVPLSEVIDPGSNLGMGTKRMAPVIRFLMDESSLAVNERAIRRIIRESFEWTPEMKARWKASLDVDRHNWELVHGIGRINPDVVYDQLSQIMPDGIHDGETYLDFVFDAIDHENYPAAIDAISRALQIDDIPADADETLKSSLIVIQDEDDLVGAVSEWIPRYWKVSSSNRIIGRK